MKKLKLRDRDAILTAEGIIFRVYGYTHPPGACICDVEYAPSSIFKSENPRAVRQGEKQKYCKFFEDEGLNFVNKKYPKYTVWHAPLKAQLAGVHLNQIRETRKPDLAFQKLMATEPRDSLLRSMHNLSNVIMERTGLPQESLGVFGSILHGFHHPRFSDLDFIIYGRDNLRELRETLETMYKENNSPLCNEFETKEAVKEKATRWKFIHYSPKEYLWHQRRKTIYGLFRDSKKDRIIKTEFEPVKEWKEIHNEYDSKPTAWS